MESGLTIPHFGPLASPRFVIDFCRSAESAGFHSVWVADHVVVPAQFESEYVLPATPKRYEFADMQATMGLNLEMNSTLAIVAAVTERVKLCTAIAVLPIRNPVLNAQADGQYRSLLGRACSVRRRSRLAQEEAEAMGMPWDQRGRRVDEQISCCDTVVRHW